MNKDRYFYPHDECHFIHPKHISCPKEAEKNEINQSYKTCLGKGIDYTDIVSFSGIACEYCSSKTPIGFCPIEGVYYCEYCEKEYMCQKCMIMRLDSCYSIRKGEKIYNKSTCDLPCC